MIGCRQDITDPPRPLNSNHETANWFKDVTDRVGIEFHHVTGEGERYFMPDQMGSGAALFDYDGDGRLDIFLIQNGGINSTATHRLFHQEEDGTFRDVSEGSGLDVPGHGMGAATGDVNNDGRVDLLVTEYGGLRLFLNQGAGMFLDITQSAGLDNPRWGTSAAFFDCNRDGWLDLVVANYLDYNPTQRCTDAAGRPEFCGPHGFPGLAAKLFKNVRGQRFEDITVSSGLARVAGPALGVVCADFDGDRWPDIFLADDGRPNRLFINQQDETFWEEAAVRGLALTSLGQTAGDMGLAMGDVNGDGMFDLFCTHLAEERHSLWMQHPRGFFQDRASTQGLNVQSWRGTGFGTALVDFDHDGDLDLIFANGRVKRDPTYSPMEPDSASFWTPYAQRHQVFANLGEGRFQDVSHNQPSFCNQAMVGRGVAVGDVNNDGAVDVLLTGAGDRARLLFNDAPRVGHWLSIRVVDPALGGREALGAEITVKSGERSWWRLAHPAFSYLSSNDPRAHVGLGKRDAYDAIQVIWPDGNVESFPGGAADRIIVLRRGEGQREAP